MIRDFRVLQSVMDDDSINFLRVNLYVVKPSPETGLGTCRVDVKRESGIPCGKSDVLRTVNAAVSIQMNVVKFLRSMKDNSCTK